MPPLLPIALLLGKAGTVFRYAGGPSIIFHMIRSKIFGKALRAVEYPDGNVYNIKIYRDDFAALKCLIAETQPPPFPTAYVQPDDIKQVSLFTTPHFTEPILDDGDVSIVPDDAWVFWSKEGVDEDPIPTIGVKLDGSHMPNKKELKAKHEKLAKEQRWQDMTIEKAMLIRQSGQLSRWQYNRIVDMAIDYDSSLLTITRNFHVSDSEFATHCVRLLNRRDPRNNFLQTARGSGMDMEGKG